MRACKKLAACLLMLTALLGLAGAAGAAGDTEGERARETALRWLELLDRGDYDSAYYDAAPLLQRALTLEKWRQTMSALAAKTGPAQEHQFLHGRPAQDLPGAPKGQYYLLVYKPRFAKQPDLLEQVALIKKSGGQWRVAGYYLK
ncbi:DUF4019 domain-containing protein [Desulfoferula mesophila]|uniref:DUF4019 domain-containing protein n=1 Tax=Desulfoferula mesophila TaxID=3058419 RepID=A0AAU9EZV4_9BACT|nr:hypothetical protein FAK_41910 [Desulfoferula mesophilus]